MSFHGMRVISSPSISTRGVLILDFCHKMHLRHAVRAMFCCFLSIILGVGLALYQFTILMQQRSSRPRNLGFRAAVLFIIYFTLSPSGLLRQSPSERPCPGEFTALLVDVGDLDPRSLSPMLTTSSTLLHPAVGQLGGVDHAVLTGEPSSTKKPNWRMRTTLRSKS